MTIRTVADLIAQLEQFDSDAPVRVAIQPSWPLACTVQAVAAYDPSDYEEDDPSDERAQRDRTAVWIAVDQVSQWDENPYAPKWAWAGAA